MNFSLIIQFPAGIPVQEVRYPGLFIPMPRELYVDTWIEIICTLYPPTKYAKLVTRFIKKIQEMATKFIMKLQEMIE